MLFTWRYSRLYAIVIFKVDFLKTSILVSPDDVQILAPGFYCASLR